MVPPELEIRERVKAASEDFARSLDKSHPFTKDQLEGFARTLLSRMNLPDGYLEVHTFSVDSSGNLFGGDNQYGRTQKFVPKPGADRALLVGTPWAAR